MLKFKLAIIALVIGFSPLPCYASPILYTPVNPDFGGNPLNGSTLLGEANAQNTFTAPTQNNSQQTFSDSITSALLGQISTNIANKIFTSTNGQSGSFSTGNDIISYNNVNGIITMTITSPAGQSTTVSFPSNSGI